MTVSELLGLLAKMPPDAPVGCWPASAPQCDNYLRHAAGIRLTTFPTTGEHYVVIEAGDDVLASRSHTPGEAAAAFGEQPATAPHPLDALFSADAE
jgi:hypothetical protein